MWKTVVHLGHFSSLNLEELSFFLFLGLWDSGLNQILAVTWQKGRVWSVQITNMTQGHTYIERHYRKYNSKHTNKQGTIRLRSANDSFLEGHIDSNPQDGCGVCMFFLCLPGFHTTLTFFHSFASTLSFSSISLTNVCHVYIKYNSINHQL